MRAGAGYNLVIPRQAGADHMGLAALGPLPLLLREIRINEVGKLAENKKVIDAAVKALEEYYVENGQGRDLKYTFGFFDALAALKDFGRNLPDFDKNRASAAV